MEGRGINQEQKNREKEEEDKKRKTCNGFRTE